MLARRFSLPTTIMILAMMRSILMQHLDIVPELRGVGSAVMRTWTRVDVT